MFSFQGFANVKYWETPKDWFEVGGTDRSLDHPPVDMKDPESYYYRFIYQNEFGRFEQATPYVNKLKKLMSSEETCSNLCPVCKYNENNNVDEKVKLLEPIEDSPQDDDEMPDSEVTCQLWNSLIFRKGDKFCVGDAIFIRKAASDKMDKSKETFEKEDKDPRTYPEYYRKFAGSKNKEVKGSNKATNPPFDIGIIEEIRSDKFKNRIKVGIRALLRSEQVHLRFEHN